MAVYTHLGAEQLEQLIAAYDVGELISAKGIAEGVSNSNWLIETRRHGGQTNRFILTMYERRIDTAELPFFLGLLDHLSASGCPVPRTIHDRDGAAWRMLEGKAVALIEFLPGVSPDAPTPDQAQAAGAALAQVHKAAMSFARQRLNPLDIPYNCQVLEKTDRKAMMAIDPAMAETPAMAQRLAQNWPQNLPRSVIHSDLFPDNVLMLGARVSGMIDFYFACTDAMAYDLAVAHAAWSFDPRGERFSPAVGRALVTGYESVRSLQAGERKALPILAQGACLRFVASRTEDWIDTPPDALVIRKNPMDFVRRWRFYDEAGPGAFA